MKKRCRRPVSPGRVLCVTNDEGITNQNQDETSPHTALAWLLSNLPTNQTNKQMKKPQTENNSCGPSRGEIRIFVHSWWEREMVQPLWKPVRQFLKKLKNRITVRSSTSTLGYITKRNGVSRYFHPQAVGSIIHDSQEAEATWAPIDGERDSKCSRPIQRVSLALKRKDVLTLAVILDIVLSDRSPSQKDQYSVSPPTWDL